ADERPLEQQLLDERAEGPAAYRRPREIDAEERVIVVVLPGPGFDAIRGDVVDDPAVERFHHAAALGDREKSARRQEVVLLLFLAQQDLVARLRRQRGPQGDDRLREQQEFVVPQRLREPRARLVAFRGAWRQGFVGTENDVDAGRIRIVRRKRHLADGEACRA